MKDKTRKLVISLVGGFLTIIGTLFILVPGPAFLFLPLGLAVLSLEYPLAKKWLRKTQRMMRVSAEKLDRLIYRLRKRS
ncbi:PGPGW domain-containing protein [Thalassotalea eurytherma]|uniref:Tellurium resistance protein TerC n=1 Tax=Thalassotalea eurytherma TaxID=1144278 RepID=A0ABQ6H5C9_9GAMM|nr:PGPGW domain-containing protein [Thalassotalea eurytherma]GLX82822.1 hypothetical protein theurythT_22740 [Thalassotalea eurytherma]